MEIIKVVCYENSEKNSFSYGCFVFTISVTKMINNILIKLYIKLFKLSNI